VPPAGKPPGHKFKLNLKLKLPLALALAVNFEA
jgi:hypothetical protein